MAGMLRRLAASGQPARVGPSKGDARFVLTQWPARLRGAPAPGGAISPLGRPQNAILRRRSDPVPCLPELPEPLRRWSGAPAAGSDAGAERLPGWPAERADGVADQEGTEKELDQAEEHWPPLAIGELGVCHRSSWT